MRILATYLIWLTYIPMIIIGWVVIPFMLLTEWDGKSTAWGNRKYGRTGSAAMPCNGFWCAYYSLAFRNPVSNYGKETLAIKPVGVVTITGNKNITDGKPGIEGAYFAHDESWHWEHRVVRRTFPGRCFEGRWGWKLNGGTGLATFVCRANPFKKFG